MKPNQNVTRTDEAGEFVDMSVGDLLPTQIRQPDDRVPPSAALRSFV